MSSRDVFHGQDGYGRIFQRLGVLHLLATLELQLLNHMSAHTNGVAVRLSIYPYNPHIMITTHFPPFSASFSLWGRSPDHLRTLRHCRNRSHPPTSTARNSAKRARNVRYALRETREMCAKHPAKHAKHPAKRRVLRVTYLPPIGLNDQAFLL